MRTATLAACLILGAAAAGQPRGPASWPASRPGPPASLPVQRPAPHAWFPEVFHDAGELPLREKVAHLFPFRNPAAAARTVKWLRKDCPCAGAWLVYGGKEITFDLVEGAPVTVPPGGEGAVKILLDLTDLGPMEGSVQMGFDDPACPPALVKLKATSLAWFRIEPPALSLGELAWNETREFAFAVTCLRTKEWAVTGISPLPPGLRLGAPERETAGGRTIWRFRGTLGPDLAPGRAGGVLKLQTDHQGLAVEVLVAAQVRVPYKLTPLGYLGFGLVRRAQGSPERSILLEGLEPERPVRLMHVELTGLNRPARWLVLERRDDPGRNRFELALRILPGVPLGELRGRVVLTLDTPRAARQEIDFSAIVR